jgi:hypothetical protein
MKGRAVPPFGPVDGAEAEPGERAHEQPEDQESPFAVVPEPDQRGGEWGEHDRRFDEHAAIRSGQEQLDHRSRLFGRARDELLGETVKPRQCVGGHGATAGEGLLECTVGLGFEAAFATVLEVCGQSLQCLFVNFTIEV